MKYLCAIISTIIIVVVAIEAAPTSQESSGSTSQPSSGVDNMKVSSTVSPVAAKSGSEDCHNTTPKTEPKVKSTINQGISSDEDEEEQPEKKHHLVKRNRTPIRYHRRNQERQFD